MPKRQDIQKILIIGAGPIIISQACEFDYSGTQACKALKEEGYQVILINSNPATIMTDPDMADRIYIEPITPETVIQIIERERPDALLPTLGGQTGLNTAVEVANRGALKKYNVEMIGASVDAIKKAEDRELFSQAMRRIGLRIPKSGFARTMSEVYDIVNRIGFPVIIRPSFTLGGTGGGVAYHSEELEFIAKSGLEASYIGQVMIEESILGWKEFELEVMRDKNDNVVIICSIENLDPMGIHTGDSITVAPAQTLSDREYQVMRDASIQIMREIGVDTGGSNVQFAVNPKNGELVVIEMNPRVSRSSALASKATGYPIAKLAAKLAVGFTLDEIPNDITGETYASFEPTLDYCVVKIPRFTFEKFPETQDRLGTAMKSVGETMAIGRTFKEALQKGIRSLEIGRHGLGADGSDVYSDEELTQADRSLQAKIESKLAQPNSERIFYVRYALLSGISKERIYELSQIDPWFIYQIDQIIGMENRIKSSTMPIPEELLKQAKSYGFSDKQIAYLKQTNEDSIASYRKTLNIRPVYKLVDTCAAEFEAVTPYYYSTYELESEERHIDQKKVIILGGGPNRIGQGIEFDYCCVHASFALKSAGFFSIMVNSNPETVSTDYDTSDKLYFEPLTKEDVLHIIEAEKPYGVIIQFGGQTPLNLATELDKANVPILGTQPSSINRAEDRELFQEMLQKLGLKQPENGVASSVKDALSIANQLGYPIIVRPSYVLGGRAMRIIHTPLELESVAMSALKASQSHPLLIEKFLEDAIELDVDAISDAGLFLKKRTTLIGGIMEHIEEAGIHSGDSACVLPPYSIDESMLKEIKMATEAMANELNVIGLMNIQFAIKNNRLYIIEVNPRASRTVPFVSKAIGLPLAKIATRVMLGQSLQELGFEQELKPSYYSVKEAVLPFDRFPEADVLLGPEMKSTGEVMGIDYDLGAAFAKSQIASGQYLPCSGTVFISVKDHDKKHVLIIAREYQNMGFTIMATCGTSEYLKQNGIHNISIKKVSEGRPHVIDAIKNKQIQLMINTPSANEGPQQDGYLIRRAAIKFKCPYATTIAGAIAMQRAIYSLKHCALSVKTLREYHGESKE
ncbi:MAG: carbamoyl-phosphate synthase large subunit [Desulfobacterales bacterium]|nr:carbamoyl-phosphate synthase large subunit [Desulfobacterales bacterium]